MEIYAYENYREYLKARVAEIFKSKKGHLSYLAKAAHCQPSYMSKILSGMAELSLDQAVLLNDPLQHTRQESQYFMLLIQYSRAGTPALREYFKTQLVNQKKLDDTLSGSLGIKDIIDPTIASSQLYDHWWNVAILALINLKGMNEPISISKRLNLPIAIVQEALQNLQSLGLIRREKPGWKAEIKKSHVRNENIAVLKHHTNWRLKEIEKIGSAQVKEKEFYTSVICLSKQDLEKIRQIMLKATSASKKLISESPDELLACFSWSLFEV